MRKQHSAFDRVKTHLLSRGADVPAPDELREDLETVVRRCDEVRSLGREYGSVELSPYMSSLLRVHAAPAPSVAAVSSSLAASV